MNKLIISLLLPFYFILYSCSGSEKYSVAISNEFIVPSVRGYQESYFYDSLTHKEYLVYYSNIRNSDSLMVFEYPSINKLYSIPMNNVWDTLNGLQLMSYAMIGIDTFCISAENNIFLFVNKSGDVFNYLDMSSYSLWRNTTLYFHYDGKNPIQNSTKFLYFKIESVPHDSILNHLDTELDKVTKIEYIRNSAPNFCRVEMRNEKVIDIQFYLPDFRNKLLGPGNYLTLGSSDSHLPVNEKYYFATKHRDTIYELLWENNELIGKYHVKSDYTNLGIPPCRFKDAGISGIELQECEKKNIYRNGFISKLKYYPNKKVFTVIVLHELAPDIADKSTIQDKSFSMIILNKEFQVLTEKKFSNIEYIASPLFTKDGFLLRKRGDTKAKVKDENYTYTIFNIQ